MRRDQFVKVHAAVEEEEVRGSHPREGQGRKHDPENRTERYFLIILGYPKVNPLVLAITLARGILYRIRIASLVIARLR